MIETRAASATARLSCFIVPIALAVAGALVVPSGMIGIGVLIALVWCVSFRVALIVVGRSAGWLIVTAPFACALPLIYLWFFVGCRIAYCDL